MEPHEPYQQEPIPATAVSSPPGDAGPGRYAPPAPQRRFRPVLFLIGLALVVALGFSMLLNLALIGAVGSSSPETLQEEDFSQYKFQEGPSKIAIISIEGTILISDGYVKQQIDQAQNDPAVKAVVLRVDSPGGSVAASDYLYHHLTEMRTEAKKPIVVSMGSIAASGGYYVAMAAGPTENTIFAEPCCWTGSIGVLIPHYNLAGLFEKYGIEEDAILSHPLKGMGSIGREITPEEKEIFQSLVDDSFARFKKIIFENRLTFANKPEALDKLATGQVYTADQAKKDGLIDQIGFIEAAIDRAIELANLSPQRVHVIRYKQTPTLASILMGAQARSRGFDLQQFFDMTAPKAFYMSTQLPPLARNKVGD